MESDEFVTDQKMVKSIPKEMLRAILLQLEVTELMPIRVVSKHWFDLIEDIIREKRMTLIIGGKYGETLSGLIQDYNGLVDLTKNCVRITVEPDISTGEISLTHKLTRILTKIFTRVENLIFNSPLDRTAVTAENLCRMLNQWSACIVTLNLPTIYENTEYRTTIKLRDEIDKLKSLKRLYFAAAHLFTHRTLARLEHVFFLTNEQIDLTMPIMGAKCTSLYSHEMASLDEIVKWQRCNAPLVRGLTHLSLNTHQNEVFQFVCDNFGALQMLNIELFNGKMFNADMIAHLARLTHLTKLCIRGLKIDLPTLNTQTQTDFAILNTVQILNIAIYNIYGIDENVKFSGEQFCKFLAKIFPNLVQLTVIYRDAKVRDEISQHLSHLGNLRKHEIISHV